MGSLKRAVLYARVSTLHGDQKPEVQLSQLREFANLRGWTVTKEIVDNGFSGTRSDRPGLKMLMALARTRSIDVVVVVKLDRLFRSMRHLVLTLQEFSDLAVEFVSTNDHVDVTTASGRLLLHLIASFAEFERELIVERTRLGISYARSRGVRLGRPPSNTFGQIASVHQLRGKGISYSKIAIQLGITKSAVARALLVPVSKSPTEHQKNNEVETGGDDD